MTCEKNYVWVEHKAKQCFLLEKCRTIAILNDVKTIMQYAHVLGNELNSNRALFNLIHCKYF